MQSLRSSLRLSWGACLLALSLPLAIGAPARAQEAKAAHTACVVPFDSDIALPAVGDAAADRVAAQLVGAGSYAVISPARVKSCAQELELTAPFDHAARAKIAARLGADQVVYGTVRSVRVSEKPTRHALSRLMVLIEDARSGEILDAALATGTSRSTSDAAVTADTLQGEALDGAARSFSLFAGSRHGGAPLTREAALAISPLLLVNLQGGGGAGGGTTDPLSIVSGHGSGKLVTADMLATAPPVVVDVPDAYGSGHSGLEGARRTHMVRQIVGGLLFVALLHIPPTGFF